MFLRRRPLLKSREHVCQHASALLPLPAADWGPTASVCLLFSFIVYPQNSPFYSSLSPTLFEEMVIVFAFEITDYRSSHDISACAGKTQKAGHVSEQEYHSRVYFKPYKDDLKPNPSVNFSNTKVLFKCIFCCTHLMQNWVLLHVFPLLKNGRRMVILVKSGK